MADNLSGPTGRESEDLDRVLDAAIAGYSAEAPRPGLDQRVMQRIAAADPQSTFAAQSSILSLPPSWLAAKWLASTWAALRASLTAAFPAASEQRVPHVSLLRRGFLPRQRIAAASVVLVLCGLAGRFIYLQTQAARAPKASEATQSASSPVNPILAVPTRLNPEIGPPKVARLAAPALASPHSPPLAPHPQAPQPQSMPEVFPTPAPLTAEERALVVLATRVPKELQPTSVESPKEIDEPIKVAEIHIDPLPPLDLQTPPRNAKP